MRSFDLFISRGIVLGATFILLGAPARALAAEPDDAAKRFGAEFIPAESPAFLSIRVDDLLDRPGVADGLKKLAADIEPTLAEANFFGKLSDIERIVVTLVPLGDKPAVPVMILTTKNGFERERFMKMVKEMQLKESLVDKLIVYAPEGDANADAYCPIDEKSLVFGPAIGLVQYISGKKSNGTVFDSFSFKEVNGKAQIVAAVDPARVVPAPLPDGFEWLQPLRQATWISLELRVNQSLDLLLRAKCGKENAVRAMGSAEAGLKMLTELVAAGLHKKRFHDDPDIANIIKVLQSMVGCVKDAKLETDGECIKARMEAKTDDTVVATAVVESAMRIRDIILGDRSLKNLRLIDMAILNYESENNKLPEAAIYSKDGKPLLSWRVTLLPYLDWHDLYKQFKLDEPWDSEHNKKLLTKIPKFYASPGVTLKDRTLTYYKVFVGKDTPFDPKRKVGVPMIQAGLSNVIFAIESGEPVPWTKPDDISVDPDKPLPKLTGPYKRGINLVAGDANVRVMSKYYSEKKLRLAIDINSKAQALQSIDEPDPDDAKGSGSGDTKPPEKGSGSPTGFKDDPGSSSAKVELPKPDADGFITIFNGKDLTGWEGLEEYWSVKEGVISGHETKDKSAQTFLVFTALQPGDFELHCKYKFATEDGNSGIQFRSKVIDPKTLKVGGYQADCDAKAMFDGSIYDEAGVAGGRGTMSNRGDKTTWDGDNKRQNEQLDKSNNELRKAIKVGDWNDVVLVAKGNHITYTINGLLMTDLTDDSPKALKDGGVIAFQLHQGYTMEVQFKDVKIKLLDEKK